MLHIKKLTNALLLLSLVASAPLGLWGVEQINEQDDARANFQQNITAHAYDPSTGTIYVATGVANGGYTLAKASRGETKFTPLADIVGGIDHDNAVILKNEGSAYSQLPSPLMRFVGDGDNKFLVAINVGGTHNKLSLINCQTGVAATTAATLTLADGNAITVAADATALKLAVGKNKAFAYVHPANPGDANSGICSATLDLTAAPATITANTPAGMGAVAGRALALDALTGMPAAGAAPGLLGGTVNAGAYAAGAQANNGCWVNDLYWNEELQVLYAGLSVRAVQGTTVPGVAYALVKVPNGNITAALDAANRVTGDHTGFDKGLPAPQNHAAGPDTVFAAQINAGAPGALGNGCRAIVSKLTGMKTSTGLHYLIANATADTNGLRDLVTSVGVPVKTVYALRVAKEDVAGANPVVKGDIVRNADGTQLGDNWTKDNLGATLVGNGELPFDAGQGQFVTQLEAVDDAVFLSIGRRSGAAGVNNDHNKCAIYVSRAQFGFNGEIIGWTTWERIFPSDGAVFGFAVDPMLGHIWQIGMALDNTYKVVQRTRWQAVEGGANNTLASILNRDFSQGCTAVLDIPQGTNGIDLPAANKSSSLALFGGDGIVAFARTESGQLNAMTADFSFNTNYKLTALPEGAGYVRALAFSRNSDAATKGYFFAGTDNGLYVYVPDTTVLNQPGYQANNLALDLNAFPFNGLNAGWIRMDQALTGAVTALDSIGSDLFVVEHDYSQPGSVTCKLIKYVISNDVTAMANPIYIATSGKNNIPANTIFNDFAIVCDDGDRVNARGLLATNVGIYKSPGAIHTADDTAMWNLVAGTDDGYLATMIKTNKRVKTNEDGKALGPIIAYLNGKGASWHEMYLNHLAPTWGGNDITGSSPLDYAYEGAINAAAERLVHFWTDGARRLYSEINNTNLVTGDELKSCPFRPSAFGMDGEETITANTTPAHIFWIENISGIGEVMVGTEYGVLSLN